MFREEIIGRARLILGDCREVLPTLPKVCAVVTDPPYGIGKDGQSKTTGGNGGRKAHEFKGWDANRPAPEIFELLLKAAPTAIIWGGNYFADMLPATGKWLVWDKGQRINQSDGELAWTSMNGALRICTMNRVELLLEGTEHPTQKPIKLLDWTLAHIPEARTILDPFMGAASTGIAAIRAKKDFIGIERDPDYFAIACRRIREVTGNDVGPLFGEAA
jgi:site-specific DNA-methyltransferase (adenine-specific)